MRSKERSHALGQSKPHASARTEDSGRSTVAACRLPYAFAINSNGSVDGMYLVLVVVTVLLDLGLVGAGSKTRWKD
jgi:hypothetical protein